MFEFYLLKGCYCLEFDFIFILFYFLVSLRFSFSNLMISCTYAWDNIFSILRILWLKCIHVISGFGDFWWICHCNWWLNWGFRIPLDWAFCSQRCFWSNMTLLCSLRELTWNLKKELTFFQPNRLDGGICSEHSHLYLNARTKQRDLK